MGNQLYTLTNYCEPRVEPEIVIALKSTPSADMDERTIANCIDWIAPGFEIVDSITHNGSSVFQMLLPLEVYMVS